MSIKNYKRILLSKLVSASWNYKGDDDGLMSRLKVNITNNGDIENIVVRTIGKGKYEVVNGNHRLKAYLDLGMKDALCYDIGEVSDAKAKRIAIELNETKFPNDHKKLTAMLKELEEEYGFDSLKMSAPLDEDALAAALESFNDEEDWEKIDVGDGEKLPPKAPNATLKSDTSGFAKIELILTKNVRVTLDMALDSLASSYGLEIDPTNVDSTQTFQILLKLIKKGLKDV
jgi:hypothetical protein